MSIRLATESVSKRERSAVTSHTAMPAGDEVERLPSGATLLRAFAEDPDEIRMTHAREEASAWLEALAATASERDRGSFLAIPAVRALRELDATS